MIICERWNKKIDSLITKLENGCWSIKVCHNHNGYPILTDGKRIRVNRYQFERYHRKLLAGECVLHNCDHKWCVNYEHLHAGSDLQNKKEMFDRGLLIRDSINGRFKSPINQ